MRFSFSGFRSDTKRLLLSVFPNWVFLVIRYIYLHKRIPNIIRPSRFTDKTLCKMCFDRNELLPILADKLSVREYVKERVGSDILTNIYAIYENEEEIHLYNLPEKFVLKANHGWGFNYFVKSDIDRNRDAIVQVCRKWLATDFGRLNAEWVYQSVHPKIFAEEYLEPESIGLVDYKVFCFDGEPRFFKVIVRSVPGAGAEASAGRFFDLEWNTMEVAELTPNFPRDMVPPPKNLPEMLDVAKQLSNGLDFLRVDLYSVHNRTIFGELTNYHNAANNKFHPPEFDYKFGSYWNRRSMTYLPLKFSG